jgi:hypothetical protein
LIPSSRIHDLLNQPPSRILPIRVDHGCPDLILCFLTQRHDPRLAGSIEPGGVGAGVQMTGSRIYPVTFASVV